MDTLETGRQPHATTRGRWAPHHTLWFWLLLGWTVSAADRAVLLFLFVREAATSQVLGRRKTVETESRFGPQIQPSRRTAL